MSDWKCSSQIQTSSNWNDAKMTGCCNCSHRAQHAGEGKIGKLEKAVSFNPFMKMKTQDNRVLLLSLFC